MSVCNIFTVLKVYCKTYHNNKIQVHVSQKLAFQKFDILKFQKFDNDYLFAIFKVQPFDPPSPKRPMDANSGCDLIMSDPLLIYIINIESNKN